MSMSTGQANAWESRLTAELLGEFRDAKSQGIISDADVVQVAENFCFTIQEPKMGFNCVIPLGLGVNKGGQFHLATTDALGKFLLQNGWMLENVIILYMDTYSSLSPDNLNQIALSGDLGTALDLIDQLGGGSHYVVPEGGGSHYSGRKPRLIEG